ncbi:MAG: VWA domain-containing protein [Magnetococcales bacterium]|nr:VWA domain-containing protein [Magnetococcales bacterium]
MNANWHEAGFHFLRPEWLWGVLPLLILLRRLWRHAGSDQAWRRLCDPHLLSHLLRAGDQPPRRVWFWLLAAGLSAAILALAGPTWSRTPTPLFRPQEALVVVLDLSRSMLVGDVPPSRLERAKQKLNDLLQRLGAGQTGLVVFAGTAFVAAPLTDDVNTIRALLGSLEPELLPVQGSLPHHGLEQALRLLERTVINQGAVLLITDGDAAPARSLEMARQLAAHGYRLSVLAVGTTTGGPIPAAGGGFIHDRQQRPVIATLESDALATLARVGDGAFALLSTDDHDLDTLLPALKRGATLGPARSARATAAAWDDRGPWLLFLIVPLAALAFRRGWLLGVGVLVPLLSPTSAQAWSWDDLWLRPDQQGQRALEAGDAARAAGLFTDPAWRGMAQAQAGDPAAAETFGQWPSADGFYNRGNLLARQGHLPEALQAYDEALQRAPTMEDAKVNRGLVEKALQKQRQEPQHQQQAAQGGKKSESEKDPAAGTGAKGSSQEGEQNRSTPNQQQAAQKGKEGKEGKEQKDPTTGARQSGQEGGHNQANPGRKDAAAQNDATEKGEKNGDDATTPAQSTREEGSPSSPQADAPGKTEGAEAQARSRAYTPNDTPLQAEQRQALEQWLQRIPDDPGGLLRRKFLFEQRRRGRPAEVTDPW